MKTVTFLIGLQFLFLFYAKGQWASQNSNTTTDLNDVFFIDGNNGWAVGRNGTILHTSNGGQAWSAQQSGTTKHLNSVFMVSTSLGYAVGENGTMVKYNGSNWSSVATGTTLELFRVHFTDANTGWISGDWGRIMKTSDGGSNWTTQMNNSTFTNAFKGLYMISANEGWAVGTSGRVLKYDGSNWSNVSTPASADLNAVHFNSSGKGFMVGKDAKTYHYDGSSWSEYNAGLSSSSFNVYDVFYVNDNLAYAAVTPGFGGNGLILKYNGNTWSTDYEYTGMGTEFFYGITCNGTSAWAVGPGGMIMYKAGTVGVMGNVKNPGIGLKAYPNPVQNILNISVELNTGNQINYELCDVSGRLLHSFSKPFTETAMQNHTWDFEGYPAGVYFLKVNTSEGSGVMKVVKK